ncbi:MAG: hypothetical protein Unbinned1693contig1002_22 [Prokaryotic dsDNA virus sp.]|jgi:hypothetical protein|nr:MAG: hypothetical protein Unbinned1693contig1002_22 [Prokaryotic dsDNA virus sp.]|tara:strand:+ start:2991 stop:3320 length:330 start_codon:yes stop_codon:yes gene_type:complete
MSEISWDEAVASSGFVSLESDNEKKLVITNWRLEEVEKFGSKEIELQADVVQEDGEVVKEKLFTTTSKRLKKKLRPILEGKDAKTNVSVSILKVGDKYDTQYSVKELAE